MLRRRAINLMTVCAAAVAAEPSSAAEPWSGYAHAARTGDFYQLSLESGTWRGQWRKNPRAGKGVVYYRYYPFFCEQFRNLPDMAMLEIGLDTGGSLNLWRRYFPKAKVFGTDIKNKTHFSDERTQIFTADQSDAAALQRMLDQVKLAMPVSLPTQQPFHFIVDDASHYPPDTIASFEYLFLNGLKPGGVYSLEDLSTSYDQILHARYGLYGHPKRDWDNVGRERELSVINYFKEMSDLVNRRWEAPPRGSSSWTHTYANEPGKRTPSSAVAEWVSIVAFAQSIVIVVKKTDDDYELWPNSCRPQDTKVRSGACVD